MFENAPQTPVNNLEQAPNVSLPPPAWPSEPPKRKIGLIILIVAVVALLIVTGVLAYNKFFQKDLTPAITTDVDKLSDDSSLAKDLPTGEKNSETQSAPPANVDSDADGLTDAEEQAKNTNPGKSDSDSDGLFDNDEVNIYKTDPLNSDTDGDSFLDGEEVLHGYNPRGDGKLLNFEVEVQKISN